MRTTLRLYSCPTCLFPFLFFFFYIYQFITKDILKDTDKHPDEELHRIKSGRAPSAGASVPMEFTTLSCTWISVVHLPVSPHMFSYLEALQTLSFWVFVEASLHKHDCLNRWPLMINLNFSLTLSSDVGGGLKVPNL